MMSVPEVTPAQECSLVSEGPLTHIVLFDFNSSALLGMESSMLCWTANFQERVFVFNVCAGANATRIGCKHVGTLIFSFQDKTSK